jgi:hypothetical protein
MEPTVEKEFGEVVRSGIYTYGETFMFLLKKNMVFCQVIRNGNQITIQSQQG